MRTIKYIFISAALLTGFVSCDLNEFPKDSISPDTFFHTESELELYTNQFYLMEPTAVNLYDEPSNLIVDGLSQSDVVVGLTRTVPSSGGGWSWSYLRYINYYLQNSHRCKDASARKRYDGVAYFWRAYFYFEKLKRFGEVPWYDQVLASDQDELLAKPRDSRDVIINHIIEDCNKAAELQLDAIPLINALFSEVNPIPVKAAMNMLGMQAGPLRAPLSELEDAHKEILRQEMIKYGLMK